MIDVGGTGGFSCRRGAKRNIGLLREPLGEVGQQLRQQFASVSLGPHDAGDTQPGLRRGGRLADQGTQSGSGLRRFGRTPMRAAARFHNVE